MTAHSSRPFTLNQILPGLVRFTIPFPQDPRRTVHSYLLASRGEALLLDAAWDVPDAAAALEAALAEHGLENSALRTVLITHLHPDHIGLAERLRARGARIGYHPAEEISLGFRYRRMEEFRQQTALWERMNGHPETAEPVFDSLAVVGDRLAGVPRPDLPLAGGETITVGDFRLRPIWTPGHTLGHLCYYEETRKLLFTGDHVLPTITPHVGLYVHAIGNPLQNYLESLRLLYRFQPELVLPAHGDPFTRLHERLTELLEHHQERAEELFHLVTDEPVTAWDVAARARWTRRLLPFEQLSPYHRRLALAETLAHLELLQAEGRVRKEFENGTMRYRRP